MVKSSKEVFDGAIKWIHNNNVDGNGIVVTSKKRIIYPEVTGYYIPSLLYAGEEELAKSFAKYLCSTQKPDGSWYDADNKNPFIFDGGQILKGLVAIRDLMPEVDDHIIKGIDWILSNMNDEGRLVQPNTDVWGTNDSHVNDLIHLYAISPILEAAKIFNRPDYTEKINTVIDYYTSHNRERIVNYTLFSHFYAYVIEGLIDCGRPELSIIAMKNLEKYRLENGAVTAYNNVDWYCSTALFQYAIIWYKLGDKEKADKTFEFACSLQNPTGGWYGSYAPNTISYVKARLSRNMYIHDEEISWAVKFYLDAKKYKEMSEK